MPKSKTIYVCQNCGGETSKWYGKCPSCGEWNTISEEPIEIAVSTAKSASAKKITNSKAYTLNQINSIEEARIKTGLSEFDRVLGGGIVKGSIILLSGDPGIGKSTILLQVCEYLGRSCKVLYIAGEESEKQIKLRAERLGVTTENLFVLCETDMASVCEHIRSMNPDIVILDSIQTMNIEEISSSSGSITQVRECTNMLLRTCKSLDIPAFIVGHVNKDGNIAGPKVLEHIVDAVLYFEGERNLTYRMLRAIKNRYGATNEIGVFEMADTGLREVENPSMMLLSGRPHNVSGSCVAAVMEGSRPVLSEVQGLVSQSGFSQPRRMSSGFDYNRMLLVLAGLEKRGGYFFSNMDAYVNAVGGLRLNEPANDLPVAIALVSNLKDIKVDDGIVSFGEIGLTGEVRAVNNAEQRIMEAARLGFTKCIMPKSNVKHISPKVRDMIEIIGVKTVREAIDNI
jgi:DNA repair protein RadA/Sms